MTRGTTPTLFYDLDVEPSLIKYAELTMNQNEKNVIVKKLKWNGARYITTLTEEETLSLRPGNCKVQIKMKFKDGNVSSTTIDNIFVKDVLNEEIML